MECSPQLFQVLSVSLFVGRNIFWPWQLMRPFFKKLCCYCQFQCCDSREGFHFQVWHNCRSITLKLLCWSCAVLSAISGIQVSAPSLSQSELIYPPHTWTLSISVSLDTKQTFTHPDDDMLRHYKRFNCCSCTSRLLTISMTGRVTREWGSRNIFTELTS